MGSEFVGSREEPIGFGVQEIYGASGLRTIGVLGFQARGFSSGIQSVQEACRVYKSWFWL